MTAETVLNISYVLPIVYKLGYIILAGIVIFLAHNLINNLFGLKIFSKHDEEVIKQFLEKYPLVNPNFYKKPHYEQTVENNQEIQELRAENEQLKEYIEKELTRINEVLKENGQIL